MSQSFGSFESEWKLSKWEITASMPEQWDQNMFSFSNGAWRWSDNINYFDLLCSTHEWTKHINVHTKVLLMTLMEKDPLLCPSSSSVSLNSCTVHHPQCLRLLQSFSVSGGINRPRPLPPETSPQALTRITVCCNAWAGRKKMKGNSQEQSRQFTQRDRLDFSHHPPITGFAYFFYIIHRLCMFVFVHVSSHPCKPFNKETLRWKKERKVWLSMFVVPGRSVFLQRQRV